MSRAVYTPVVRKHSSKPQGRVDSPQRTLDSGDADAVSPQTQNLTPSREDAKGEVAATAVLCRFGISPRIQENERESKKDAKGSEVFSFPLSVLSPAPFAGIRVIRGLRIFVVRLAEKLKLSLEQNQPN